MQQAASARTLSPTHTVGIQMDSATVRKLLQNEAFFLLQDLDIKIAQKSAMMNGVIFTAAPKMTLIPDWFACMPLGSKWQW